MKTITRADGVVVEPGLQLSQQLEAAHGQHEHEERTLSAQRERQRAEQPAEDREAEVGVAPTLTISAVISAARRTAHSTSPWRRSRASRSMNER